VNSSGFEYASLAWLGKYGVGVGGSFSGVKHFDHLQGCWIAKENMRLAVNESTWIFFTAIH
jgi:hypothetical protein